MAPAERRAIYETPAGPIPIETPPGVHPIAPSTVELARLLDVRPGERVVELGCGAGLLSIVAAKLGAGRVVAVDIDEQACRAARENARANGVALDVRQGSFLEPLQGERFDLALFNPPQTPGPRPFGPKWGGKDGALHLRVVLPQLGPFLRPGERVLLLALSLVDQQALEDLFRPFDVDLRSETERPFEAAEYEGYAPGLVAYLEGRAREGSAVLHRHGDTSFSFRNRFYRLRSRWPGTRLVVNADDLGLDDGGNEGIVASFERGIVRSASLVANGPAFADAILRLEAASRGRCGGLDVGLHANLSEGRALGGAIEGLTSGAGEFLGAKHEVWRRLEGALDPAAIEREIEAQRALVASRGVRLSHLDGHQHGHAFPAARGAAIAVARRHGLALRIPDEPLGSLPVRRETTPELERIRAAARGLRDEAARAPELRLCCAFRGLAARVAVGSAVEAGPCVEELRRALEALPDTGLVELMVHPGSHRAEREALGDPSWPDWLAERGVALSAFDRHL